MRFAMPSLLIGCMALALARDAQATSWTSAKFPGEQDRAVQGCADDAEPRRLVLHIRPLRPAEVAAHPAFLDPGTGYSRRHQAGDRRGHLRGFGAGVAQIVAAAVDARASASRCSDRSHEGGQRDLGSGLPTAIAIQSNFIAELAQGHRKNRVGVCAPISQRRQVLAAPDAEPAFLLIGSRPAVTIKTNSRARRAA